MTPAPELTGSSSERRVAWLRIAAAVLTRPRLWPIALRSGVALAPKCWWRRWPFLPLPDRRWMRFRVVTAYGGDGTAPMRAEDVVTWLEWRRQLPPGRTS